MRCDVAVTLQKYERGRVGKKNEKGKSSSPQPDLGVGFKKHTLVSDEGTSYMQLS